MVERLYSTADLPGIGGVFKATPADFDVTEVPLYEAEGEGEHLYLQLRREGMNTRDLVRRVARIAGVNEREVGYAGLKDRNAVATQTLSLSIHPDKEPNVLATLDADDRVEVLAMNRHRNKLKRGHLLGNRFRIRIRDLESGALETARAVLARLETDGLPNFFGAQRYGRDGRNAELGAAIVAGRRERDRFLRELYLHAWQSRRFDAWLAKRLEGGHWHRVLKGDIARIEGRGGLFLVEDLEAELPRARSGEISATGPMIGAKMMSAQDDALAIEQRLDEEPIDLEQLRRLRLPGTRRAARVFPRELEVEQEPSGALVLSFFLPKGSYATSLLGELMKTGLDADGLDSAED